jgi:hypothetical protein
MVCFRGTLGQINRQVGAQGSVGGRANGDAMSGCGRLRERVSDRPDSQRLEGL